MLTEGWDTNTVTNILGVRAFGTQLLCEQVVSNVLHQKKECTQFASNKLRNVRCAFRFGELDVQALGVESFDASGLGKGFSGAPNSRFRSRDPEERMAAALGRHAGGNPSSRPRSP